MKKLVSNSQFEAAYANCDNQRIIYTVLQRFYSQLSRDTLQNCANDGLWKAIAFYDSTKGMKFTTYLYKYVMWECQKAFNRQKRCAIKHNLIKQHRSNLKITTIDTKRLCENQLNHILTLLNDEDRQLLVDRYIGNKTYSELSVNSELTPNQIRSRIINIIKSLRKHVNGV